MKILIPSQGEDILSEIDDHFIKAKLFISMDTDNDTWEVIENEKKHADRVLDIILNLKIEAFIVKYIGEEAFKFAIKNNIKIYHYKEGKIKIAVDLLRKGKLSLLKEANRRKEK